MPVSTTHVVSGSIMGVGSAKRVGAVRWGTAQQMLMAWVLTIPCTAIVGALVYYLMCFCIWTINKYKNKPNDVFSFGFLFFVIIRLMIYFT